MKIFYLVVVFLNFVINVLSLPDHVFRWSALQPAKKIQNDQHLDLNLHLEEEWVSFKNKYRKISYNSLEDESLRKSIFENNLRTIKIHNYLFSKNLSSYEMAVNQFSDLTFEEFQGMNGYKQPKSYSDSGSTYLEALNVDLPDDIDWRAKGYVTNVKNQRNCGSCWAFSATGAIEGQHFRKTGKLVSLSEQNLVDCSSTYGNHGCNGGLMDWAFQYVKDNRGIDTEESYPYMGVDQECRFTRDGVGATVSGFVKVESGNEKKLMKAIAEVGPVSVAIDAGHSSFQHYSKGVYDEPRCSSEDLNHGVLAVGYGQENGKDYWLVKNSWGTSWGDAGYIKMMRNKANQCGIATEASYPLV